MYDSCNAESMSGQVAAYFDLDGTLLDSSSEKTLTAHLVKKRPWRIPVGTVMWTLGLVGNLLRGRSLYDAARNRGHFSLASWTVLENYSTTLAENQLKPKIPQEAWDCLAWHRNQGHRLVLVTATIAPMAEAMAGVLGMDAVYGCGPDFRNGIMSGSESGWSVPRRKGKVPIVQQDADQNGHDLTQCFGYGNTMADTWFMRITGNPIAVNPDAKMAKMATEQGWQIKSWKI